VAVPSPPGLDTEPSRAGLDSGPALFARYAFPPNELGYCGPGDAPLLLRTGASGEPDAEVGRRARLFDGAWPYLELIAEAAGLADPLDRAVVRAYWLGGPLLDAVAPERLDALVRSRFGGQPGVTDRLEHGTGVVSAGPHHGFHVLVVYPWIGLVAAANDVPRSVLDSCRIRWGRVLDVSGERARVAVRPLRLDGRVLSLSDEQPVEVRWSCDGHAFVADVGPGQSVALHWDWVCDRLDEADVAGLEDRTQRQLLAANAWLASSDG